MRIIITSGNDSFAPGSLFFTLPHPQALKEAEQQIAELFHTAWKANSERLEFELQQMKNTKTAFHFLLLKEIATLSQEEGYSFLMAGDAAGSLIAHLLGISPINPDGEIKIARELIWGTNEQPKMPDFSVCIAADVRPLIQKRLDQVYGNTKSDPSLFYRISLADSSLCEVKPAEIAPKHLYAPAICRTVLQELAPEQANSLPDCNFPQLVRIYAYLQGSFAEKRPLAELIKGDEITTRDELFFALLSHHLPALLAAELAKKGVWSTPEKKLQTLSDLEKYNLPEDLKESFCNARHLWCAAACIGRVRLLCQKAYHQSLLK